MSATTPSDDLLRRLTISAEGPAPAYYQLFEALRTLLGHGPFSPGTKLPTERTIAETVGVSRQTVRQALARLEREGLVFRRQGDGTYVSQPRVEGSLRHLTGFTTELSQRGVRVRSRVLDLRPVIPQRSIAQQLSLPDDSESAIMLQRVRSLDGTPAALETVWLPAERCAGLLDLNMEDRSLYAVLRDHFGLVPSRATERLSATVLDEFEATELERRPGDPALLVERSTVDSDGRPLEVVKSLLRADRFSFTAELDLGTPALTTPQP